MAHHTIPELALDDAKVAATLLQERLVSLLDLQLTLKHIHWNVVGPNFIAVHEMLDEHVESIRAMTDEIAERIAILGFEPVGTPAYITKNRAWDDYPINRGGVGEHLKALDSVYDGIIGDHRKVMASVAEADSVTEDLMIGQLAKLELYQWFVRSHIANTAS